MERNTQVGKKKLSIVVCSCLLVMVVVPMLPKVAMCGRLVVLAFQCLSLKKDIHQYRHEQVGPWPAPVSREELFQSHLSLISSRRLLSDDIGTRNLTSIGTNKIIWGHWHQGADNLPGFCQLALESWKMHHPDWHIIILSEANYKNYISHEDLPSTFNSLKLQTRGDIMRSSVLRRYGGIYLDMSYVLVRALDDIWESAEENEDLYLTSLWTIDAKELGPDIGRDIVVPNNALIVAPRPNNPVLNAMHKTLIAYLESPSYTTQEMKHHPVMSRVSSLMDKPSNWIFSEIAPYIACLWSLVDTMYFDPELSDYVKQHVYFLPTLLWTFDTFMAEALSMPEEELYSATVRRPTTLSWVPFVPNIFKLIVGDDPVAANNFASHVNAVKASSDFSPYFNEPPEFHLSLQTTQGQIWRAALDKSKPIRQATTKGAYHVIPVTGSPTVEAPEHKNGWQIGKGTSTMTHFEVVLCGLPLGVVVAGIIFIIMRSLGFTLLRKRRDHYVLPETYQDELQLRSKFPKRIKNRLRKMPSFGDSISARTAYHHLHAVRIRGGNP